MSSRILATALALIALAGCREPDRPTGPGPEGGLFVDSDPPGAAIIVNNRETGLRTPDTVRDVKAGEHEVRVLLDTAGLTYGFTARVQVVASTLSELFGSLLLRCGTTCPEITRYLEPNRIRFATNPAGLFLYIEGQGAGLLWPGPTGNSYASVGAPVFAAVVPEGADTVGLGPYDSRYLAGRPAPSLTGTGGDLTLEQTAWVLPTSAALSLPTVRGIAIAQRVLARSTVDDVVVFRLVFRNVSATKAYRAMDPVAPPAGITYEASYVGFALDGDIGVSEDDLISYDADLNLAFLYDSDFHEPIFAGGFAGQPGLIGLRLLEAPAGTTMLLNGWPREISGIGVDWGAGDANEPDGWYWLSATQSVAGNHAHPRIGYAPTDPNDLRISVSAGPLRLAPGDSAAITVALVLAAPATGTYSSGTLLRPGDPTDPNRQILRVAAPLLERAQAAEALVGQ
ncbi:MAG: PEGA domain-containing protein [Gemmatimonadetes bacterium]|nr:PEGA domain-containing protein [Gemmatimonadota bacterium]